MPRLIIDMDEVMADTYEKFVEAYALEFGRRPSQEELHGKKVYDLPGASHLRDAMYEPGFFRDVKPMPG
ncbi:MAG: 5'(3')-deoxyribonucleotidase, partial [Bacteroidota bacterium]